MRTASCEFALVFPFEQPLEASGVPGACKGGTGSRAYDAFGAAIFPSS